MAKRHSKATAARRGARPRRASASPDGVNRKKLVAFHQALQFGDGITRADAKKRFGWKNDATFSRWLGKVEKTFPVRMIRPERVVGMSADHSCWRCEPLASIPLNVPTETAALFAHLCGEFGPAMLGTAGRNLAKFAKELDASMPQEVRDELASLKDRVRFFFRQTGAGIPGVFGDLVKAIATNRLVEMEYESASKALAALTASAGGAASAQPASPPAPAPAGKARKKTVPPPAKQFEVLGIYFAKRSLYAVVREHGKHDPRSLDGLWSARLDRIKDLRIGTGTFDPPPGFSVAEYMKPAWEAFRVNPPKMVTVTIRVDPSVHVNIASTTWHPSQRYEFKDGKHLYRFRVDGFSELKYWVLSLGPGAEVVSPPQCRTEMAKLLRNMSMTYGAPP